MNDNSLNLLDLLDKIDKNEIILPDFQRDYVWIRDDDKIVDFIASVLAQLPLGNIITFKDSFRSFANKEIGFNKSIVFDNKDKQVSFLLDGQQRVTTLSLVFSDRIFRKIKKNPYLYSPMDLVQKDKIRRRYVLQLPNLENEDNCADLFGLKTLCFPFKSTSKVPFCSYEIIDMIKMETFTFASNDKNRNVWYYPSEESYENVDYVQRIVLGASKNYQIPLYLLTDHIDIVEQILENISSKIVNVIKIRYPKNQINKIKEYMRQNGKYKELNLDDMSNEKIYASFLGILESCKKNWPKNMIKYLTKCIENIKLLEIDITDESPARAINMYEALNRGGAKLTTYDLIIARAASVSNYNTISYAEQNKNIISTYYNEDIFSIVAKNTGVVDWNSKDYLQTINRNGEIAPIVINQFLNLLCFVANYADSNYQMPKMILTKISNDCCKAKAQLNLDASKIVAFSPLAMKSIIDALMVLQFKCGIYNVSQIDYNLLLFPLSYIMYLYESKTIGKDKLDNLINILCGLFMYCIFTGEYSYDQSTVVMKHLEWAHNWILCDKVPTPFASKENIVNNIDKLVLNVQKYNDLSVLLFENDQVPKKAVRNSILHYVLSEKPHDFIVNPKIDKLCAYKLDLEFEIHHVVPLASAKTIKESTRDLRDRRDLLNSPLNLAIISKDANREISSMKIYEYKDNINSTFLSDYRLPSAIIDFDYKKDSSEKLKDALKQRYDYLKSDIISEIRYYLGL